MTYAIKWVTVEEYVRLKKELEEKTVWPSGVLGSQMGFTQLVAWDEASRQRVLIKVAETELFKELL